MPFTTQGLLQINLTHNGGGFRGNAQASLLQKVAVINVLADPFDRSAYLAMVLIADQPFMQANHRTTATAIFNELGNLTIRTEDEIATWLRMTHEWDPDGLGLDVRMLQEQDTGPVVKQARMALIEFLGG
jgi:hypothetical protein